MKIEAMVLVVLALGMMFTSAVYAPSGSATISGISGIGICTDYNNHRSSCYHTCSTDMGDEEFNKCITS